MDNPDDIKKQIDELHGEITKALDLPGIMLITPIVLQKHAKIVDLTSQLGEISSKRLERQTNQLIYLTWALVALTAGLLILTFCLVRHG